MNFSHHQPCECPGCRHSHRELPIPASHPKSCHSCEGTGWEQIAPFKSKANGFDVEYSQLIPCSNKNWVDDDPDIDDYGYNRTIPLTTPEGRARGRDIAGHEYELECRRQGREPDWDMFNRIVGQL